MSSGAFLTKDGTYYRFTLNRSFGHLDVHFTNAYATREDCLLMLKCARTAALKEPYTAPATLADLEKLGVKVERDGAKVTAVSFGKEPLTDGMLAVLARELPDLEVLDLSGAAITDDGLRALAGMKNLRRLILPFWHEFLSDMQPDDVLNGSGLALKQAKVSRPGAVAERFCDGAPSTPLLPAHEQACFSTIIVS